MKRVIWGLKFEKKIEINWKVWQHSTNFMESLTTELKFHGKFGNRA